MRKNVEKIDVNFHRTGTLSPASLTVITVSNYDRSTNELLRMVNWVNLDRQRLVDKAILMYKIVNRMVPDYLSSHFAFRSDTLTYNLRESDFSLAIPQPRTNYCKRSLS